jgi:hypothetical protein
MSNGRIHVTLDPTIVSACENLTAQMEQLLPFLLRLKPDEKNALVKPHPGAQEVMQTIADLQRSAGMPPDEDDPMLADLSVYAGLTTVIDCVSDLLKRLEDTRLQAGSEGWSESLIRYGILRQMERRRPELKAGLDRIRPLITSRSNRRAPGRSEDAPQDPTE